MHATCAKPGCAAVPTIREDVKDSRGMFARDPKRSYVLCQRHDEDYFGSRGWLTAERSERIKTELIPWLP